MATVRLTRRVAFSSGHRYWLASRSAEENRALFGRWASPYNHGHNYVLDVTTEGDTDPATGMVVNIKRIDDVLQERVVAAFDQTSLNDEVAHFHDVPPTLENLLVYLRGVLVGLPARLVALRLEETPLLWGAWRLEESEMTLTRVYEFAASHRLHCPALPHEENLRLFGKCNNPNGHGHNYVLEVTISGQPDPQTGMMADLEALDAAVLARVIDRYDHKNLDADVPELAGRNTTSEVVAQAIFDQLDGHVPARLHGVRLHETARNVFEVTARP